MNCRYCRAVALHCETAWSSNYCFCWVRRPACLTAGAPLAVLPCVVQAALSRLVGGTPSLASLADALDLALPLAQVHAALTMMQLAVSIRTTIQGLGLPAAIAALQDSQGNLTAAQPQLAAAQSAMDSYVATFGSGGGMSAGGWAALVSGVQAAGSAVGTAAAQLPANLSAFTPASTKHSIPHVTLQGCLQSC